jgi:crotonobetainyl-CoA:carnitine CoA-transferase CaiB-like acyl-CoA transferase
MDDANLFKNITVLSLEQATVLPYLTLRLAEDGANVIRMEHPYMVILIEELGITC